MFWTYFMYAFGAWLIAVLLSFETYNSAQVNITNRWDSYKNYFGKYLNYHIASFIFLIILVNLINIGALPYLMKEFFQITLEETDLGKTVIINKIFCFIIGLNIEFVMNIMRRWKRPVTIEK